MNRTWPIARPRLILAIAALLAGCGADADTFRPFTVGDPAPDFALSAMAGDTVRLSDLRGGPVLLNIWATWCPPCREEMPGLQALHETYGQQGLHVVGVSIDARGAEDAVRAFAGDFGIGFTLLHDPGEVVPRQYRTSGVPETFLIDADGVLAYRWIGAFDPLAPDVHQRIQAVLPQ
ncbi:MAG TPA: TlpA disulfide reductase family protein [Longimicrobiales bacterium]|nr:TlpA disulfide reductase family protein [Longimicrobiales bacterium]